MVPAPWQVTLLQVPACSNRQLDVVHRNIEELLFGVLNEYATMRGREPLPVKARYCVKMISSQRALIGPVLQDKLNDSRKRGNSVLHVAVAELRWHPAF